MSALLKVKGYAEHIDYSPRTVRKFLADGMPHLRLPSGRILIPVERADKWLDQFLVDGSEDQKIIDELLENL